MIEELIPVIGLYMALLMSGHPPHEAEKFSKGTGLTMTI
jgi:hypothetical protein